jgi:hypothetical protein
MKFLLVDIDYKKGVQDHTGIRLVSGRNVFAYPRPPVPCSVAVGTDSNVGYIGRCSALEFFPVSISFDSGVCEN